MKPVRVIAYSNLPAKFPIVQTLTLLMASDFYHWSEFAKGAMYFGFGLMWICLLISMAVQKKVDIFEGK